MSETAISVSIVIVNYNVKDLLLACLNSLNKYLLPTIKIETVLVDNNSKDGSIEAVKQDFPNVIIIENKFNAGFPVANNQAFQIAKGDYIFMLNPDAELIEDALSKLINYMEQHDEISLIAPMLLNTDGSRQLSVWREPKFKYLFYEVHYMNGFLKEKHYADKDLTKPFEAECFSGAAILFRKNVFDKIGMLDEKMFWIEDTEFCYRAFHAGLKLLYYPDAKVLHHIGQSAKLNYNISISNQIFNKIKFYKKHHSTFAWMMVVLLSFYHVVIKIIVFGLLAPFNKVYFRKAKAYLYTLPRVFNPPIGIN
ncbi:MAG: glycosyltransferase family 2 protein [Bacteroidia bacterium]